jgi:hypothetical protein
MPGNRPDEPGASSLFAGQRCSGKIVTISNRILFLRLYHLQQQVQPRQPHKNNHAHPRPCRILSGMAFTTDGYPL